MIALLAFIQFALPHEDHMTKQYEEKTIQN